MEHVSGNRGEETTPGFLEQYARAREGEPTNGTSELLESINGAAPETGVARQAGRARLSQWRGGLSERGCARLEVIIGKGLIEQARAYAKSKDLKLWEVVEEALSCLLPETKQEPSEDGE